MGFTSIVFGVVKKILGTVLFPLKPIIDPLLAMGEAMIQLLDLLTRIIKLIPKLLELFEVFTDPVKLIKDAIYGIKAAIILLFDATIGVLLGSLTKNFKQDDINSDSEKKSGDKQCFSKSLVNMLVLVLCPPLAIFMDKGLKSFFSIVIAAFLTYFYYFPGLIYSSLYIL